MPQKWTTPAPKYGPTATFGDCEVDNCEAAARKSCETCSGDFCFGHADHEKHLAMREH